MSNYDELLWLRFRVATPDTYLAARCTSTRVQIVESRKRRWWQVWKPKQWMEVLATAPYALQTNDSVELSTVGEAVFLSINGDVVLRHPPKESAS